MQTLATALFPCYLRIGGTDADFLIFDTNATRSRAKIKPGFWGERQQDGLEERKINSSFFNKSTSLEYQHRTPLLVDHDFVGVDKEQRFRRDIGYPENIDKDYTNFTMSGKGIFMKQSYTLCSLEHGHILFCLLLWYHFFCAGQFFADFRKLIFSHKLKLRKFIFYLYVLYFSLRCFKY